MVVNNNVLQLNINFFEKSTKEVSDPSTEKDGGRV